MDDNYNSILTLTDCRTEWGSTTSHQGKTWNKGIHDRVRLHHLQALKSSFRILNCYTQFREAQDGQGRCSHHQVKAELSGMLGAEGKRKDEREWAASSQLGQLWGTVRKFLCFSVSKERNCEQPHAFHFLRLLSIALSAIKAASTFSSLPHSSYLQSERLPNSRTAIEANWDPPAESVKMPMLATLPAEGGG